ncbi:MAG: radical SAM protein [Alphaproteobacteria bacterium]
MAVTTLNPEKFRDPALTLDGQARASVGLRSLDTLWFNTGTLCNITCVHCYIESSPTNDRLAYLGSGDAAAYLDEIQSTNLPVTEIGFTGGEPFMNPEIILMLEECLARGFRVLVLTNAMQPMRRPKIAQGLLDLRTRFGEKLTLRVSLDHYAQALHETERGAGAWRAALDGLKYLSGHGFSLHVAGRLCWGEDVETARAGYARLFAAHDIRVDADDPAQLVLFPEMDAQIDVPEITTACWGILNKNPEDVMCASSRMVVKRKGATRPAVVACTLLPYDPQFEMGESLAAASGAVSLNHPHCAKFCVLGGASCKP